MLYVTALSVPCIQNSAELLRNINEDTGNFFGALQAGIKLLTELMVCLVLGVYLLIKDKTITISVVCLLAIMLWLSVKVYKKIWSEWERETVFIRCH